MYVRRHGTIRGVLRAATALTCTGLILLAVLPLDAPLWAMIAAMVITAPGLGVCLLGTIISSQNAVPAKDVGAGTGALLVLRSIGGASGSTLAGALIASGLAIPLESIQHDGTLLNAGTELASSAAPLASNFALAYGAAAIICATAFLITLRMPNIPLRGATPLPSAASE